MKRKTRLITIVIINPLIHVRPIHCPGSSGQFSFAIVNAVFLYCTLTDLYAETIFFLQTNLAGKRVGVNSNPGRFVYDLSWFRSIRQGINDGL